jgi:hypothetical protein
MRRNRKATQDTANYIIINILFLAVLRFILASYMDRHKKITYKPPTGLRTPITQGVSENDARPHEGR